jgi:hypothetical protein
MAEMTARAAGPPPMITTSHTRFPTWALHEEPAATHGPREEMCSSAEGVELLIECVAEEGLATEQFVVLELFMVHMEGGLL